MRPRPVVGPATVPDAVRRLLDTFDYPDRESPAPLVPILPTLGLGGGGAPDITVAASNAFDKTKADLVCSGTGDDVEIQAAMDLLPDGGKVLLTNGLFSIDNQLLTNQARVSLVGSGWGTIIRATSSMTSMFKNANAADAGTYLADIHFDGNALATFLIQIISPYAHIYHCEFLNATSHGVAMGANNQPGMVIYFCYIHDNAGEGLNIFMDGYSRVISNYIASNGSHGVKTANNFGEDGLIATNQIVSNTGWGVHHGQGNIFTVANMLDDNAGGGISGGFAAQSHNFINGVVVAGGHASGQGDGSELTISAGAVTITTGFHAIDTQADAGTDELDTINGGTTGQILVLRSADAGRDPTLTDGVGNLILAGANFTLSDPDDTITLIYEGANWLELNRSDNS